MDGVLWPVSILSGEIACSVKATSFLEHHCLSIVSKLRHIHGLKSGRTGAGQNVGAFFAPYLCPHFRRCLDATTLCRWGGIIAKLCNHSESTNTGRMKWRTNARYTNLQLSGICHFCRLKTYEAGNRRIVFPTQAISAI